MTKFLFLLTAFSINSFAQVAVGKNSTSNNSVSLEFGAANKGLLLPWVTSASSTVNATNGTLIFDVADKKVKYRKDGIWFDFTNDSTGVVNTSLQDNLVEKPDAKVVIGKNSGTDVTPGILVLSDSDKAMILPKVASPQLNIINPAAGMIVFDTDSRQMATFNGTVWSFWKGI